MCVRANLLWPEKPFDGEDRQPFQGNVEQIVEDIAAHARIEGINEILLDMSSFAMRHVDELLVLSRDLYAAVRAAGV